MFIGDSLQRGQFESMICLIQSVIPERKKSLQRIPPMKIFKIEVYQLMSCTHYYHILQHLKIYLMMKLEADPKIRS